MSIENMKIILDIEGDSQDTVLTLYFGRASNFVKDYCNVNELSPSLNEIAEDIAVYSYQSRGIENLTGETKGSLSEKFRDTIPEEYFKRMNQHKRLRFI